jgi:Zn-dependent protease
VLIPVLLVGQIVALQFGLGRSPDVYRLLVMVAWINGLLLVFNLLPIYPLDGGQILRSLLWFRFGRVRSLQVVAILGFITIPVAVLLGIYTGFLSALWGGILGFFLFSQAMAGWQQAQALAAMEEEERLAPRAPERPPVL